MHSEQANTRAMASSQGGRHTVAGDRPGDSRPADALAGIDPWRSPSFGLRQRLHRALWNLCQTSVFALVPRPWHGPRVGLLRLFGARIGPGSHVYPGARVWAPWLLEMADQATLADRVIVYNMAPVRIGRQAVISQGAHLCTGSHDANDPRFPLQARPIEIGRQAWICAEAFIGPGVSVPEGSVVAARAVLMRSPGQAWGVHAGNPARRVGSRTMQG
jgi:putative colanic acid biosynthesis acetyltransferase WcaF